MLSLGEQNVLFSVFGGFYSLLLKCFVIFLKTKNNLEFSFKSIFC